MNDIMSETLKCYDTGDYVSFLKALSKEYYNNRRLIKLENPGDQLDYEMIVTELLDHGFRPDGIAYLLNEILCRGHAKIPNRSAEDLKN